MPNPHQGYEASTLSSGDKPLPSEVQNQAHALEGLFIQASLGDIRAVNALQNSLQSLSRISDSDSEAGNLNAQTQALNSQFEADAKQNPHLPSLGIYTEYGAGTLSISNLVANNTNHVFSVDQNGGIDANNLMAYPASDTKGKNSPFQYENSAEAFGDDTANLPTNTASAHLEYLALGARDGNSADASQLQTALKTLQASGIGQKGDNAWSLNTQFTDDSKNGGPSFGLIMKSGELSMEINQDKQTFSENSVGKQTTTY